jgi:hypothetical protein
MSRIVENTSGMVKAQVEYAVPAAACRVDRRSDAASSGSRFDSTLPRDCSTAL